ncbi:MULTISPECIES: hypothetical protein [unclassified Fusobacterium]|uniref:hypothetical protein n=1 Tax=unclassified Fusobacterium TaxID=2648384 RepID=UPI0025C55B98|nr:hypothetical protein [Fusobacterium sp.]
MAITISLHNKNGNIRNGQNKPGKAPTIMAKTDEAITYLSTQDLIYEEGDYFKIVVDEPNQYLMVRLDESLNEDLIYLKGTEWIYTVPIAENRVKARVDTAFTGKRHYISVRYAEDFEISQYRNLARNTHALNEYNGAYPYAFANVETRNEATFFACNAIDGVYANNSHGSYPYASWGINQQLDAALTLDFGREVEIDRVDITIRCDFPHDSYWTQATLEFSDGSKEVISLNKIHTPQKFRFEKKLITWVRFQELIQDTDPSPFPALTQLDVYGKNNLK